MGKSEKISKRWKINYPKKPNFKGFKWRKYPTFKLNWEYSYQRLSELNEQLNTTFKEDKSFSVLVAGSYGRLDANEKSDLDFLIIHDGHISAEKIKIDTIRQVATNFNINLPKAGGAFSKPCSLSHLISSTGSDDENLKLTAQRMLILMECRPVYNEVFFKSCINEILDHYLALVEEEPEKEALVLLNDLIRYFRGICLNVEFSFWEEESKWGLRNIKLRHSRILIYVGLLLLILNSSKKRGNKISYLRDNLTLSPVEKIYEVYKDNNDYNFDRVLGAYNNFLQKLGRADVRDELRSLDYQNRYSCHHYAELKTNSDFLQSEFTRFILDNKCNWSSKIFEYLIF